MYSLDCDTETQTQLASVSLNVGQHLAVCQWSFDDGDVEQQINLLYYF